MADRQWIARVVDTKGRPCPLLGKKCPGASARCAFWVEEVLQDGKGSADLQAGCLYAWHYVIAHEQMVEQVRGQASVDKLATATASGFAGLGRLLLPPELPGQADRDAPAQLGPGDASGSRG